MDNSIQLALTRFKGRNKDSISRHLISDRRTVKEALEMINALPLTGMTLFAIDSDGKLAGTVTDGDVRRAIIAGALPDDRVSTVMYRHFSALLPGDDIFETAERVAKRGVELLPALDPEGFMTDLIDLKGTKCFLPLDAVMMAGGKGERLRPLTAETPKPLLKVGGKCIIDYNIDELHNCGVENIYVTVNYLKEQLIEHFSAPSPHKAPVCVAEPKRMGTIGSLSLVNGLCHDNVLLMNSDILTDMSFKEMYLHHIRTGADLTIAAIPYTVSIPFAIMKTKGNRVMGLSEKPTFNHFANAGVYILKRDLISRIRPDKYLDAPDFISALIRDNGYVTYFPINGTWIDIGSPDDFRYANELMSRPWK